MSFNVPQTTKSILTNVECLDLVRRLRFALARGLSFEQAVFETATPELVSELEGLIYLSNHLHSEVQTEEEQRIRKYLGDSVR